MSARLYFFQILLQICKLVRSPKQQTVGVRNREALLDIAAIYEAQAGAGIPKVQTIAVGFISPQHAID